MAVSGFNEPQYYFEDRNRLFHRAVSITVIWFLGLVLVQIYFTSVFFALRTYIVNEKLRQRGAMAMGPPPMQMSTVYAASDTPANENAI